MARDPRMVRRGARRPTTAPDRATALSLHRGLADEQPESDTLPFTSFHVANWLADTGHLVGDAYQALHRSSTRLAARRNTSSDLESMARLVGLPFEEFEATLARDRWLVEGDSRWRRDRTICRREYARALELKSRDDVARPPPIPKDGAMSDR